MPLEVMLDNMRHFQQLALDAEGVIAGLTSEEILQKSSEDPKEQFKFLLAEVKRAAGLRQMAQECARDAASFLHAKLASVAHTNEDGGPLKIIVQRFSDDGPAQAG